MRRAAWIAAGVAALCLLALAADFAIVRVRAAKEDALILALQKQVESNAALAPKLEAEQNRIAVYNRARKARVRWLAWILLASSAAAVTLAKKVTAPPAPYQPAAAEAAPKPKKGKAAAPRTAAEPGLADVDGIIARLGGGKDALIPILQAIQERFRHLPEEALRRVCEKTEITPAQLAGVASFYAGFRHTPVGEHRVRVCHGTACHVAGARQISDELRRSLRIPEGGDTDAARLFTLEEVACLGCCSLAPVLTVDGETVGKLTPGSAREALDEVHPREMV